jgi:hypothetical protein
MAGTPEKSSPRVVKDYLQPRKFLRDMRARAAKNARGGRATSAARRKTR